MALTNPTIISRASTVGGPGAGNADRFVKETADTILMYGPDANPITVISRQAKKESVGNQEYTVMNDKHLPRDRKSTRLNSSHLKLSRMPSSA